MKKQGNILESRDDRSEIPSMPLKFSLPLRQRSFYLFLLLFVLSFFLNNIIIIYYNIILIKF